MRRCFQLAKLGNGHVAPNPMVGSVIVHEGNIIGEGYHTSFGKPHAEIEAINSVKDRSVLSSSTLYVNLEPCSHYGKTPPCADRLIKEGIREVVIAASDPNPLVAGNGVKKLRDAGILVTTDILKQEAIDLNKRFYCFHQKKRPFVVLKWAQTSNGKMGHLGSERLRISNDLSNVIVHKWRSEEQAILVGKNTALNDDPSLDVRLYTGKSPQRIVIDPKLELPNDLKIFKDGKETIVLNLLKDESLGPVKYNRLSNVTAEDILQVLYKLNISSVLIEGGAKTHQLFIDSGLWDEARVITSTQLVTEGLQSPVIKGVQLEEFSVDTDEIKVFRNPLSS